MKLSVEQGRAVTREKQDVCCVAGPGSGKTRVLVERYAWLAGKGYEPSQILAITFTEKATRELKQRLAERFSEDAEKRRAVERAAVYTIDGFCHSLLRAHAIAAGLDPEFQVADEREATLVSAAAMERVLDRFALDHREELLRLLDAWAVESAGVGLRRVAERLRLDGGARAALAAAKEPEEDLAQRCAALQRRMRESVQSAPAPTHKQGEIYAEILALATPGAASCFEDWADHVKALNRTPVKKPHPLSAAIESFKDELDYLRKLANTERFRAERATVASILIAFEDEYTALKRARSVVDFADLGELALALLERNQEIRREVRERFQWVLMDELQDTSPIQWKVVDLVRGERNFFGVGDINQSIFGFRQARPEIFASFQTSIARQGEIDRLTQNYRSRPEILEVVNQLTAVCPGVLPHTLAYGGPGKPRPEARVELLRIEEGWKTEPAWVAARIEELWRSGQCKLRDIAILARKTNRFDEFEDALLRRGIPCVVKRGKNFFDQPEIVDLTNWLRVLENPLDEIALAALLRSPFFGVADETLYRRRTEGSPLSPPAAAAILSEARALRAEMSADRILAGLIDRTGYEHGLTPSQRANVGKFLALLRNLSSSQPDGFGAWVKAIEDLRRNERETGAPVPGAADAVEILTVHTAKGLEWPTVFVVSMESKSGGMPDGLLWDSEYGLGVSWKGARDGSNTADLAYSAAQERERERETAEAGRLLYVALTRAQERLCLSWQGKAQHGTWAHLVESALRPEWGLSFVPVQQGHVRTLRVEGEPQPGTEPSGLATLTAEVEWHTPLAAPLQPPSAVSVTALARWQACPRRHLLSSILHWPEPGPEESSLAGGAKEFGVEVHELLGGLRDPAAASQPALELLRRFTQSPLGRRVEQARSVEREYSFLIEFGGLLLQGAVDLWFRDAGGRLVLVDYKTDRLLDPAKLDEYRTQLRLYGLAVERATGQAPDEAWLYLLREDRAERVPLDGGINLEELIASYLQACAGGEYTTRPGEQCRFCAYSDGACPEPKP